MHVGIVIANNTLGGSQRVAINLYDWLARKNIKSTIIFLKETNKNGYEMCDRDFIQIKEKRIVHSLSTIIKKEGIDCLISMGVPISVYTVPACFGKKIVHIISERNDPSHFSGKRLTKFLSRFLMNFCDGYVFQTNQAKDYYRNKVKTKPCAVIYNPLPPSLSSKYPTPFEGERKKTIVSVGRLIPQKNQMLLIEAFSNIATLFKDYNLVIWGEGSERTRLEKKIKDLRLSDRIFLAGETDSVFDAIFDSSLFVLSSDYEGMPNSLIEAMAMGLPCISTDCPCGGPSELISDGKNGVLVPVNDSSALEKAIISLLSNTKKRQMIGYEAIKVQALLDSDKISSEWFDFIEKIYKSHC